MIIHADPLEHLVLRSDTTKNSGTKVRQPVGNKQKDNYLLDIIKTTRFRLQYGSMVKHFIQSNAEEDYIKLESKKGLLT